jgi:hypothetical protein
MGRPTRSHAVALAVTLTVLGSAGTALVAVVSGTGAGFGSQPGSTAKVSGLAADPSVRQPAGAGPGSAGSPALLSRPEPIDGAPTLPPAAPDQPNVVHRGSRTMNCPKGVVPMVQIHAATFSPQLQGGTTFGVGRYRIAVRGLVANETSAPIELRSLQITVDGRPWHQTSTVAAVPAQGSAPISFEGSYDSRAPHRAVVDSRLQWQWKSPGLRPCGQEGLVEDD